MTAGIQVQDLVVKTLGAKLDLRHTQRPQMRQFTQVDVVWPGLDRQPYVPVLRILVRSLRLTQRIRLKTIQRIQAALDEPFLVIHAVGAPGAAKDQELDLVRWMSDGLQGLQPGSGLLVGIEAMLQSPHRAGLVGQV